MNQHRPPAASLQYDEDFYAWSQDQAEALRALRRHSESLPVEVDLDNVAEEIEDLGKAELRTVTGLTQQILIHLIKAASAPHARALPHWRVEATTFSVRLSERYVPSMRGKIDGSGFGAALPELQQRRSKTMREGWLESSLKAVLLSSTRSSPKTSSSTMHWRASAP